MYNVLSLYIYKCTHGMYSEKFWYMYNKHTCNSFNLVISQIFAMLEIIVVACVRDVHCIMLSIQITYSNSPILHESHFAVSKLVLQFSTLQYTVWKLRSFFLRCANMNVLHCHAALNSVRTYLLQI